MKVAIAQIDCEVGDISANSAKAKEYILKSSDQGADVVVLPEISDLGYLLSTVVEQAQSLEESPYLKTLKDSARNAGVTVISGLAERSEDSVYNLAVAISPEGELFAKYRKTHLVTAEPMCEDKHLGRGDELLVTDVVGIPSGFMTCYEIRFPEISSSLSLNGAKIIYIVSAFPLVRVNHWRTLIKARAIENQVFVVAANRVGHDGEGLTFCGASQIIDPYGVILSEASEIEQKLVTAEIDISKLDEVRQNMKVRQDRRPELYGSLI